MLSILDLHSLTCASPSCSRMTNRVLRFLTLPISSMSQAEQCSACPCMVLSVAQEGQERRGTVCLPVTEETIREMTSERGAPRIHRELRQVAACAGVHKHACRLKSLPPLYWVCRGIFGRFTRGLEHRNVTELGITLTQQKASSHLTLWAQLSCGYREQTPAGAAGPGQTCGAGASPAPASRALMDPARARQGC